MAETGHRLRWGGEVVMARAVVAYDRDLPEIQGRRPWEPPVSHLIKDDDAPTGWREDESGRRPSRLLLAPKIRDAVDAWRDGGYPGASEVTSRLFEYLVRGGSRSSRLRCAFPVLLLPARSDRDAGLAGGDCRPARHQGAHRSPTGRSTRRTCSRRTSSFRPPWTASANFAATCRSWSRTGYRTCRPRTCAGSPSRWPPARGRPG